MGAFRRRAYSFGGADHGQALPLVAIAMVVVLLAAALAVDWGYGLTVRRVMQNAADGAALAAGKLLATSVVALPGTGGSTNYVFSTTQESVYCKARVFADANRAFGAAAPALTLEFGVVAQPGSPSTWYPPTWQTYTGSTACPETSSTQLDPNTRFVRVTADVTFHSLYQSVNGGPALSAAADAIVRLTGTPIPAQAGPTWPMVRHFDPNDFVNDCVTGNSCSDPTKAAPTTFWSSNDSGTVYGNFKGAVDLSLYSTYYPYSPGGNTNVRQLITTPDSGTDADMSQNGNNCTATWSRAGDETPTNHDNSCDVPNWFYYSYGGTLSLDTAWGTAGRPLPPGQSPITPLGPRSICPTASYITAPSCADDTVGDWVEATGGDIGSNFGGVLRARINQYGTVNDYSGLPYPNKNQPCVDPGGPNESNCYGKALTVTIFLWDCAADFNGGNWALVVPQAGGDCSQLKNTANKPYSSVDRVHLFAVAPFTFYEALVTNSSIQGFWGGLFGNASSCPSCALNPLSNSAYLVGY